MVTSVLKDKTKAKNMKYAIPYFTGCTCIEILSSKFIFTLYQLQHGSIFNIRDSSSLPYSKKKEN